MTLQERLREAGVELSARGWRDSCGSPDCGIASNLANEAADALDAQEKRIKELEGALHEIIADSMCTAYAAQIAEEALK